MFGQGRRVKPQRRPGAGCPAARRARFKFTDSVRLIRRAAWPGQPPVTRYLGLSQWAGADRPAAAYRPRGPQ
eukprot:768194-Hanusia_phi.AAC.8